MCFMTASAHIVCDTDPVQGNGQRRRPDWEDSNLHLRNNCATVRMYVRFLTVLGVP